MERRRQRYRSISCQDRVGAHLNALTEGVGKVSSSWPPAIRLSIRVSTHKEAVCRVRKQQ